METTHGNWGWWVASLLPRLTGPIFDKEMRVSSRRRRNYVLRFLYIGLFTLLMAMIWAEEVVRSQSSVYQISRMAGVGQAVVVGVLWFQFFATQIVAVVMLSTSISDEIYKRTLGVLMTTPIGSLQIVIGKLTSRLLQIVLLLAISLPLLAVVRVFGGVPWGYLLCGLCVTLTTVVFLGSLSLFFSIFTRRAYTAILETILAAGFLFGFVPLIVAFVLAAAKARPDPYTTLLSYVNPYAMMFAATISLSTAMPVPFGSWPVHCAVMLGGSVLLLLVAMIFVRKAALRQAVGASGVSAGEHGVRNGLPSTSIRRVQGPPVLWKERCAPLFGRRRLRKLAEIVSGVVILALLLLTYGLCLKIHILTEQETHVMYGVIFFAIGVLFTVILPATCITTERESQTWPLLLTTTVGDWEIVWSKFAGAVRRCLPAWALLFGHVTVFAMAGIIHPIALIQLGLLVAWLIFFLTSTGLYLSNRLHHTTTAVIANMGLATTLWAVIPLFLAIMTEVAHLTSDSLMGAYVDTNPFVHVVAIMLATAHKGGLDSYQWAQRGMKSLPDATAWMVLTSAIYAAVGFAFLTRAAARLRQDPF